MTVHHSGDRGIALYIDAEEIAAQGYVELGEDAARAIAENAMHKLGMPGLLLGEIEAFTGAGGAMIFASLKHSEQISLFCFQSLDDIMAAAKVFKGRTPPCCRLILYNGTYILRLINAAPGDLMLLSEFGRQSGNPESASPFFEEHGTVLLHSGALERFLY